MIPQEELSEKKGDSPRHLRYLSPPILVKLCEKLENERWKHLADLVFPGKRNGLFADSWSFWETWLKEPTATVEFLLNVCKTEGWGDITTCLKEAEKPNPEEDFLLSQLEQRFQSILPRLPIRLSDFHTKLSELIIYKIREDWRSFGDNVFEKMVDFWHFQDSRVFWQQWCKRGNGTSECLIKLCQKMNHFDVIEEITKVYSFPGEQNSF